VSALVTMKDILTSVSQIPEYQSWKLNVFLSHGRGWTAQEVTPPPPGAADLGPTCL
jgi:hypothetical protein